MKSVFIVLLSLLCFSACQQEGKLSTSTPTEELPTVTESDKKVTTTIEENDTPTKVENIQSIKEPTSPSKVVPPVEEDIAPIAKTSFTSAEVANHNNASDCWLILSGKVYEVTDFIPSHPGGKAILKGCGKDATEMFANHKESAKAMKEKFYIGDLAE